MLTMISGSRNTTVTESQVRLLDLEATRLDWTLETSAFVPQVVKLLAVGAHARCD